MMQLRRLLQNFPTSTLQDYVNFTWISPIFIIAHQIYISISIALNSLFGHKPSNWEPLVQHTKSAHFVSHVQGITGPQTYIKRY